MSSLINLSPGSIFAGEFRVVRALKGGGMGAVYVAVQLSTGAERALKLMHPHFVADETMRRRFEIEARVGAQIQSDHVVQIAAAGIDAASRVPWIAMELLHGEDLDAYLKRKGVIEPGEVREIFEQLCHAIGAAHEAGIVHRDLKPENVFLASARRIGAPYVVKVLDFGIAKVATYALTAESGALGTPYWMAPEQTSRGEPIAPSTDVWALGLIAFRLLVGKHYWQSANDRRGSLQTLLREILIDTLVPASERAAEHNRAECLPPGFDAWFARSVVREPKSRFENARHAWMELDAVLAPPDAPRAQTGAVRPAATPFSPEEAPPDAAQTLPLPLPATAPTAPTDSEEGSGPAILAQAPLPPSSSHAPSPLPEEQVRALPARGARSALGVASVLIAALAAVLLVRWGGAQTQPAPLAQASAPTTGSSIAPPHDVAPPASRSPLAAVDLLDGVETVPVSGGSFAMGSNDGEDDERPVHTVTVQAFQMDKTEVSVGAYRGCVEAGRCTVPHALEGCNWGITGLEQHPVNCVDWMQSDAYCKVHGRRLPTEEEWEYAARGPQNRKWPWGSAPPSTQLCWNGAGTSMGKGKRESSCPVGSFVADKSPFGVLDMAGNVSEWTVSRYCPYPMASCAGASRSVRGATWADFSAAIFRTTYRGRSLPSEHNGATGFRCARTP